MAHTASPALPGPGASHPMLRKAAASPAAAAAFAACSAAAACDDVKKAEADVKKSAAAKKPADPKSMAELQLGLATKQRRVFVTSSIDDESAKVVTPSSCPQPSP